MNLSRRSFVSTFGRRSSMSEWSFSSTAELVVGIALALVVVALVFV
jgi:hypothetical protein